MADHRCEAWTVLGISCPGGLRLTKKKDKKKVREPIPADPSEDQLQKVKEQEAERETDILVFPGRRGHLRTTTTSEFQQAQMAMLLELYRRSITDAVGRRGPKISVSEQLLREVEGFGIDGRQLAIWVAAAATTGAVALKYGPRASRAIPRILPRGGLIAPGGQGAPAGAGYHFQAPQFEGIKKRIDAFISQIGHDFSGTEG